MATKKYVGENALLYFWGKIKTLVGTKVDKVEGKGLSTNDYTTAEKNKLGGIDAGAQVNVIESVVVNGTTATIANKTATVTMETGAIDQIKVNGAAQTIVDKAVDITVPTTTSQLTNNSNFISDSAYVHTDNNYTTIEKNKLSGIDEGAEVNVLEGVKVNGTALTIDAEKKVNVPVPVNTSDLINDSNFVVDSAYVHTDNNYTTTEKNKLSGLPTNAEANVIDTIKVNGTAQTVTSKAVDITVPTNNNQLTNGAGYQTSAQVQAAINTALEGITGIDFQIVTDLPASGTKGVIYLKLNGSSTTRNIYDEYIWLSSSSSYEKIGTTEIDLTNYVQFSDLVEITNGEIDTIVAS